MEPCNSWVGCVAHQRLHVVSPTSRKGGVWGLPMLITLSEPLGLNDSIKMEHSLEAFRNPLFWKCPFPFLQNQPNQSLVAPRMGLREDWFISAVLVFSVSWLLFIFWLAHCPTSFALGRLLFPLPPLLFLLHMALQSSSTASLEMKAALWACSVQVTAAVPGSLVYSEVHPRSAGFRSNFPHYQRRLQAAILIDLPLHASPERHTQEHLSVVSSLLGLQAQQNFLSAN